MATKYSDAIRIRETKSAYSIQNEESNEWKNFIPNEQFNSILNTVLDSVSNKLVDAHKSFWLEGTYGTGKSHAAAVIKHLLCDPAEEIEEYVNVEFAGDKYAILRQQLISLRKHTRLFPVTMYGHCTITQKYDLTLQIQKHIVEALKKEGLNIVVRTDFDNYIANIEMNPDLWDLLISSNSELSSYAPDRKKLIKDLRDGDTTVLELMKATLHETGINVTLKQETLRKWFFEVQDELAATTPYKGILLIWDEFTDVMLSDIGPSLLVDLQELAEATQQSTNNSYFFHIAHPSALDNLNAEERKRTIGRYHHMHYNMEPVSAFKIMSRKFMHEQDENSPAYKEYEKIIGRYFPVMSSLFEKYAETSTSPLETIEDLKQLFPVHPGTANLATYYAREAGSSSRSVFEFLGSNKAVREFLDDEVHFRNGDMITADYLWDFVLTEFNSKVNRYGVVTERYNSYNPIVEKQGPHYAAVFKAILLLNALNNLANNSTVTPSEENIRNLFACTPIDQEMDEILDWINTNSVVQRSPLGIFEIKWSQLNLKEVEDFKKNLRSTNFKYTWQILKYGDIASKFVEAKLKGIWRPFKFDFYSEDVNEHTLLSKIDNGAKSTAPYELCLAFLFARNSNEIAEIKDIVAMNCAEERFKKVAFFVFDTTLPEQDYNRFIEYQANAQCASKYNRTDEAKAYTDNAKAIITEWLKTAWSSGTMYIHGKSEPITALKIQPIINSVVAPIIYYRGPESLDIIRTKAAQPTWEKQHAKTSAENVLLYHTKDEIIAKNGKNGYAKQVALLLQDSVDDNLEFKTDCDPNHPLLLVWNFVKNKIDNANKQLTFNVAEQFRELTLPPYGFYHCNASYGMLAFALRPYVDKVFDTNGKPINAKRMQDIIYDTFKIWETGSSSKLGSVDVKFETKEESAIAKGLVQLFSLNQLREYKDVSSLIDARWALRSAYCAEVGYPLWALKYCSSMQDLSNKEDLCKMIDNIIAVCSEAGVKEQQLMSDTAYQLTTLKYEMMPLLHRDSKNFEKGFRDFLMAEKNVKLTEDEYSVAVQYIRQHTEKEVGFWTEQAVIEQLLRYRVSTINPPTPTPPTVNPPTPQPPVAPNTEKRSKAINKIESMDIDSAKATLKRICDLGYDAVLDIILS